VIRLDEALKKWLEQYQISYILHSHPAVFTVEEAQKHCGFIPGTHCKNLFVKDLKKRKYYLVTLESSKRLKFKELEKLTNWPKIIFADESELQSFLGLSKGAVSPFGLVNDKENHVEYLIDKDVWAAEIVSFHPNINTETLELKNKAFQQFVKATGNRFQIISFPS